MADGSPVPRSDSYRIVLVATGPGLVAGTMSSALMGYGVQAPNAMLRCIFTYAYLLLWSLPALPLAALALASWIPRGNRAGVRDWRRSLLFLAASVWHLIVLELIGWIDTGTSFVLHNWERIAVAYVPTVSCTVVAWLLYLSKRHSDSLPLP